MEREDPSFVEPEPTYPFEMWGNETPEQLTTMAGLSGGGGGGGGGQVCWFKLEASVVHFKSVKYVIKNFFFNTCVPEIPKN